MNAAHGGPLRAPLGGVTVAHVTTVHDSRDTRIRYKECPSLVEAGAEVHLVAPNAALCQNEQIDGAGIRLRSIGHHSRSRRLLLGTFQAVRAVFKLRPDVVHFHDPELLLVSPLFRLAKAVVIYDIHEDTPRQIQGREWIPSFLRNVLAAIIAKAEPLLARMCHGYVMVEDWTHRFPHRPAVVVRNVPIKREFENQPAISERPSIPTIVYLGSITEERGALDLVQAINHMNSDCELVLAGPVSPSLAVKLEDADLHDRLRLTGFLDRDAAIALLTTATVGVLLLRPNPAYDVALATKLHEYALAGLPMVLSNTTAHRKYASAFRCAVVVDGQNACETGVALDSLLGDPELRATLRNGSQLAAESVETWETEAAKLVELYEDLLETNVV